MMGEVPSHPEGDQPKEDPGEQPSTRKRRRKWRPVEPYEFIDDAPLNWEIRLYGTDEEKAELEARLERERQEREAEARRQLDELMRKGRSLSPPLDPDDPLLRPPY